MPLPTNYNPLPIEAGGTGSITPSAARTALGIQFPLDSINVNFTPDGTGAVARPVQAKDRDIVSVKDFGAVGDGVTDDKAAMQAALDVIHTAGGGALYIPHGTYNLSSFLTYNAATAGALEIFGEGAFSVLQTTGATNGALTITGTRGATQANLVLRDFQVVGANSGTVTDGILLDGLAVYSIHDVRISGGGKFTNGIHFTATQQGEWSGGYVNGADVCAVFDAASGIGSNGCDLHGVSFSGTTKNITCSALDSIFIHDNHFEIAASCIEAVNVTGLKVVSNHIENGNTIGVNADSGCPDAVIAFNTFIALASANDVKCAGTGSTICGNKFAGNVELVAGASNIKYFSNTMGAASGTTLTDNATNTEKWGNKASGSGDPQRGANFNDSVTFTSRATSVGKIGLFKPNAGVGGAWGIGIEGAGGGTNEIYVELGAGGPVVESLVSADQVLVKSAIGGTTWTKATGTDFSTKGKIYPPTDGGALQTAAGLYAGTGVPNNANGANGDIYFRSDGGAGTTIYQRRAGTWVATGA